MKNVYMLGIILCTMALHTGCSEDENSEPEEEVTIPDETVDLNPIPDQTTSYTGQVKAIIDAECLRCHGNPPTQAPTTLANYESVVEGVQKGNLLGRLKSTNNVMPPTGKIADEKILLIEDWIADGLKN
ncbi:hypothetical protein NBT05_17830 [Aquimarina sp. ERC-38]|uniref:hypothetical protein n=1 Tax=Aquimarina sp. ERC-38 TaxID=2949996 RepID=UPI002246B13F|nr:hypothetical protein [Aquimarina sp. ERC-38]UZO80785.1 hypothetical protein NBT05_17830 [Aquimarina sp. ERC-38]